jgi:hypothetical protein
MYPSPGTSFDEYQEQILSTNKICSHTTVYKTSINEKINKQKGRKINKQIRDRTESLRGLFNYKKPTSVHGLSPLLTTAIYLKYKRASSCITLQSSVLLTLAHCSPPFLSSACDTSAESYERRPLLRNGTKTRLLSIPQEPDRLRDFIYLVLGVKRPGRQNN